MNNPGTTVYVHWYGKLLQGTVINGHDLMGMVAVRIPLQGGHPVALFTPGHVYESETAANGIQAGEPHKKMAEDRTATSCKDSKPSSEAWLAIQQFKADHWDHVHNRLQLPYWKEFELLWRHYVAKRRGMMIPKPQQNTMDMERPMTPEEAMQRVIPSTDNGNPDYLGEIQPRTIGKPITVTELSLF